MDTEDEVPLVVLDPPEILAGRARKKLKVLDEDCVLLAKLLFVVMGTLSLCLYCTFYCSHFLLVIMIASACCCTSYPVMALPFLFSLLCYVVPHRRALAQAFTLAEDVYAFQKETQK
jgi:hypothetical protein